MPPSPMPNQNCIHLCDFLWHLHIKLSSLLAAAAQAANASAVALFASTV
jgi:hypothetical protein